MQSKIIALAGALACAFASPTAATASPPASRALSLHTTASPTVVRRAGRITFTIRVLNRSSAVANEVTICDQLPADVSRVSHSGGLHLFDATACRTLPSLPAGQHIVIDLVAQIGRHARLGCARNRARVLWAGERLHATADYRVTPLATTPRAQQNQPRR
jgi:uncharacterized repeat protein (TIGR01451 family)